MFSAEQGRYENVYRCLGCSLTIFSNNDVGVGAAIFVDVVHGILHAVHHLNAALQVSVFRPQRLDLRGAEGQVGGKPGPSVDLDLGGKTETH